MTKTEKAYIAQLVSKANTDIKEIKEGTWMQGIYKSDEEKKAAMQAIAYTIEPLAELVGRKIEPF